MEQSARLLRIGRHARIDLTGYLGLLPAHHGDAAVREAKEETGVDIEVTGLVGLYTNPGHVMAYDDGEVRQQFSICFTARITGGNLRTSNESKEVAFVSPTRLSDLNIHPSIRMRIEHGLSSRPTPYIG